MKIAVFGATGLIGNRLVANLLNEGHHLLLFSRPSTFTSPWGSRPEVHHFQVNLENGFSSGFLEGIDGLVNLIGTRIRNGRWSQSHRDAIRTSRIACTRNLVEALHGCRKPPMVFISASATGFYGNRGNEILTEESPGGEGFLARVTRDWEAEALRAASPLTRVVLLRSAPVLDSKAGALNEIVKSFKMGFGGILGPGTQWMPWIHLQDEVKMIIWALQDARVRGALNVAAPESRTNRQVLEQVARVMGKRLLFRAPAAILELAWGEMAREMLLSSQRVVPEKALNLGFRFDFPSLEGALHDLLVVQ